MGQWERVVEGHTYEYKLGQDENGQKLVGNKAWLAYYSPVKKIKQPDGTIKEVGAWNSHSLANKIEGFVEGGANFLGTLGLPIKLSIAIIAVLVASFAATTLDTATRLQRYVVTELGQSLGLEAFSNKYVATGVAVTAGLLVALTPGANGPGSGGLILWPLFGAVNQLLAGLAFLVIAFYLKKQNRPVFFMVPPAIMMLIMPAWAMLWHMFNQTEGWLVSGDYLLFGFGGMILVLQGMMVWEGMKVLRGLEKEK